MLLINLMSLIRKWKIRGIGPLDLIHWHGGRFELAAIAGNPGIRVWIHTGNPFDYLVPRTSLFAKEVGETIRRVNRDRPNTLTDADIRDRFKSHGKLWLVLANGTVVDESTVRVFPDRCRRCKRTPTDQRESKLWQFHDRLCLTCFSSQLPETDQFDYAMSTCRRGVGSGGYRIHYDPILGVVRGVEYAGDKLDRSRAMSRQPPKDTESHDDPR